MKTNQSNSLIIMSSSSSSNCTPSSSTSSIDETKCVQKKVIAEDKSIFYEASLAQAECDDDLMGDESSTAKKSYSNFDYVDDEDDDSVIESSESSSSKCQDIQKQNETHDAKEYWATIDFYNNSKLAFNKRLKSVKLKRERLNTEMRQRKIKESESTKQQQLIESCQNDENLCNCVKCSIIIHEALIQGIQNVHDILCKKCHTKMDSCKCNDKSINTVFLSTTPTTTSPKLNKKTFKNGFTQFEEKLFNIKNELVNLSETSLDVFQLLLQLSDTVLDLNNQMSSSTNVNQLFLINSNSNLNQNFFSTESPSNLSPNSQSESPSYKDPSTLKQNKIEDFLQKNFYPTQTDQNSTNKQLNNSITNIINKINNRSTKVEQLKKVYTRDTKHSGQQSPVSHKFIENIYDKTSVTQFVDSLLNSKTGDDLSRASSGFYSASSLLTMANNTEDDSQNSLSDTSQSYSIKQTPNIKLSSLTNNILTRQQQTKSSSSNLDLTDVKTYRHSTVSTSSSNTDSSIDQTRFLTIQSPKNRPQTNGTVAGLAANFNNKNLGSSNTISSGSSCTSPVPTIGPNGARKPSFKFENNTILNRVQNMNMSKHKFLTPQMNDISETETSYDKRCSLNREYASSERVMVKRQQSVCQQSKLIQPVKVSEHDTMTSLDSGINLQSENEDTKLHNVQ